MIPSFGRIHTSQKCILFAVVDEPIFARIRDGPDMYINQILVLSPSFVIWSNHILVMGTNNDDEGDNQIGEGVFNKAPYHHALVTSKTTLNFEKWYFEIIL